MVKSSSGFTLLEMLLVLMVVGIGASLVIASAAPLEKKREEDRFFALLEQDIHYAQSQSYAQKTSVMLVFWDNKLGYEVMYSLSRPIYARSIPKSVTLTKASNISVVHFTPSGSIFQPGTMRFSTSSGERTVTIHLGKGRVVVSK
ncbi:competence type IV pilus minor pilin ComGD [Planococcus maritimus]|uniref:competence type IV pilus minor pilin ComGD n=1 Tax=Planococcus maritimus TaxID=192421 RepID=UPI00214FF763|nr:competence type IV pilus minor pilin ComGD [Planococcus maritimus]